MNCCCHYYYYNYFVLIVVIVIITDIVISTITPPPVIVGGGHRKLKLRPIVGDCLYLAQPIFHGLFTMTNNEEFVPLLRALRVALLSPRLTSLFDTNARNNISQENEIDY